MATPHVVHEGDVMIAQQMGTCGVLSTGKVYKNCHFFCICLQTSLMSSNLKLPFQQKGSFPLKL